MNDHDMSTNQNNVFLGDEKLVFDVGCHKGEDAIFYLSRGYRVVGFECAPENVNYLRENFKKEIESGIFQLETRALSNDIDALGEVVFYEDANSVWGTTEKSWAMRNEMKGSSSREIRVKGMIPNEIFGLYGNPLYIKIDIEGQDLAILESVRTLSPSHRPKFISIESSITDFADLTHEIELFSSLGYYRFQAIAQSKNYRKVTKWKSSKGVEVFRHSKHSSGPFGDDLSSHRWISKTSILKVYTRIFFTYRLFGNNGILSPYKIKNKFLQELYFRFLYIIGIHNWYDTHAARV